MPNIYRTIEQALTQTSQESARAIVKVTKANDALPNGPCRAVCCGTAGTMNGVDVHGNVLTDYPLQAGYNPIQLRQVSTGGTADNIWALY